MRKNILNTMKQEQLRLIRELSLNKDTIKNTAFLLGFSIRHTKES